MLKEKQQLQNGNITPAIKWAGGKRQLLPVITQILPTDFHNYFEPFIGGGAVFLHIAPVHAHINDFNKQLIGMYEQIRSNPNEVCSLLQDFQDRYNKFQEMKEKDEYYYELRKQFNGTIEQDIINPLSAALLIFLNKACFNGVYRVNASGKFNVPPAHKKKVNAYSKENIEEMSKLLQRTEITCGDFEEACETAEEKDFIFFDSPYYNTFDTYQAGGFSKEDHLRLYRLFRRLSDKGVYCMLTNSNDDYIKELYKDYDVKVIDVKRMINRDSKNRVGKEIIVKNY